MPRRATLSARRAPCWGSAMRRHRVRAGDSITTSPWRCFESIIGLPLRARRSGGHDRAAGHRTRCGPPRRHVHRARDAQRRNGRSAGQRDLAVLGSLPGHARRSDGVPQDGGARREQRRGRSGDAAAADGRRRSYLDDDAAARRALLQRCGGEAGRRALHVRAAVQGPRAHGRVALRRDRGRRPVPAEPGDLHARPRRDAERLDDRVPPHRARQRLAAEARTAARGAAAAEHGSRGDRHRRLAPGRHRPVLLGVLRACQAARPASQPVLQGLGAGRPAGRLRRSHRAALRAGHRGRGHRGRARPGGLGRRRHPARPAARAAAPLRAAAAREPVARRLVHRAQLQHQAVRRDRGAAGRQSRDRQERDRQALRRAAVRGADLPGDPARLPGIRGLLPVDARRHRGLVGPGSRARAPARRGVGHRRRPGRHRRRRRRRAEGHRRVHSGRAAQARIRPARESAAGRRPVRLRAELAQPRGGGALAVDAGISGAVRGCWPACSAATPSCPTPMRAPTSAGSATARRWSR